MKPPSYPRILTNADWQKRKGKIAKLAGKTGIGSRMDAAKEAFDNVNWSQFDLAAHLPKGKPSSRAQIEKLYATAVRQLPKVKEVDKVSHELARVSLTTAMEWRKSKRIPSSARKQAEAIHNAAMQFNRQVAVDIVEAKLAKQRSELEQLVHRVNKQSKLSSDSAEDFLQLCARRPDREDYVRALRRHIDTDIGRPPIRFNDVEICKQAFAVFGKGQLANVKLS